MKNGITFPGGWMGGLFFCTIVHEQQIHPLKRGGVSAEGG